MSKFIKFNAPEQISGIKSGVIALGVFDGVHRGHCKVVASAAELAGKKNSHAAVLTFIPHPRQVIAGKEAVQLLMPENERLNCLRQCGAEIIGTINFSREIAAWDAEYFLNELIGALPFELLGICVGSNWRFGKHGCGNRAVLEKFCGERNITFIPVEEEERNGNIVSSTAIRQLIHEGKLDQAADLAGRAPQLSGRVVPGMKLAGKDLAAPTANLEVKYGILPPDGVYAGRVTLDGNTFPAVLNIGPAPTYDVAERRVEIHLLNFKGDLYDRELTVYLKKFIREIRRFSSPEELKKQIAIDILSATETAE